MNIESHSIGPIRPCASKFIQCPEKIFVE